MLRDMEAADACAELDSGDEAANWAAAEPTAGHGGRLRFGGAGQQQHSHLVCCASLNHIELLNYIVSQYGVSSPHSCSRPEAAHGYMTAGIVLNVRWSSLSVPGRDWADCMDQERVAHH